MTDSHLHRVLAEHMCISHVYADVLKQANVAQLPCEKVAHEAAQSKNVALLVIAFMLGHLHSDQM